MNAPLTERGLWRVLRRVVLALFGLFLAWRFLTGIATIALLIVTGLLLAVALSGPIEALNQRKVPRMLSAILIFAGGFILLGLGGVLLYPILEREFSLLASALPGALSELRNQVEQIANRFGLNTGESFSSSTLMDWGRRLLGGALGLFSTLASALIGVVVVVFIGFYLAAAPVPILRWTEKLFPPEQRPCLKEILWKARSSLLDWLKGRLISMAIVGVLFVIALYIIGIPGALFLGIFAGLVSFLPYIGPVIAVIPAILMALVGGPSQVVWVLVSYSAIQLVESYLITPIIMEETASLHPAVVIASIAGFGAAFGILGALVALPLVLVAGVLVEELWFRRWKQEGSDSP